MIKISFKALTSELLKKGHSFTIEKSKSHDRLVFCFIVGLEYPNMGPVVHYEKADFEASMDEVRRRKDGKVIVLYDTTNDSLLGVSCTILDLIKTAKQDALAKVYDKPNKEEIKSDPYGRAIQLVD